MQLRAMIAEDEPVARQAIVEMANSCGLQVLAECGSGTEVMQHLAVCRPDLLFLDVQMPGSDGFTVLEDLPDDNLPAVIFTTAYDHYAVKAFEHNAVDYLLKPFDEQRFSKAVERARLRITNWRQQLVKRGELDGEPHQSRASHAGPQRLAIRSKGKVEIIKVDDIDWIEARHNSVQLHVGTAVHAFRQPIREIEVKLQAEDFLRIHRSLIVNVDRIRCLESCGYGEYLVVLKNGKSLPMGRSYREHLDRFLAQL